MDKKAIGQRLRALASQDENRSKAARLRDVIDDVEIALASGVSRTAVMKELATHGLVMTLSTFESTLRRLRQKRAKSPISSTHSLEQHQYQQPKPDEQNDPVIGSHNPAALDKIIGSKPDLAALAKLAKRKTK